MPASSRPLALRPVPAHALSPAERAEVLRVATEPRFADVPPARLVPKLADEGVYIASESTFGRVLREHGQNVHRGRAKSPRKPRPPRALSVLEGMNSPTLQVVSCAPLSVHRCSNPGDEIRPLPELARYCHVPDLAAGPEYDVGDLAIFDEDSHCRWVPAA